MLDVKKGTLILFRFWKISCKSYATYKCETVYLSQILTNCVIKHNEDTPLHVKKLGRTISTPQ